MLCPLQVPSSWQKLWPGPSSNSAVDYLRALMVRAQAAELRYKEQVQLEFAAELDLKHVYNCENLLACLKLLQARKLGVSTQRLRLQCLRNGRVEAADDNASVVLKLAPLKVRDGEKEKGRVRVPFE